jgi:hypothetical protein
VDYREKWYSEKELGDLFESNWYNISEFYDYTNDSSAGPTPRKNLIREFPIGNGFCDFVQFKYCSICLIELKITASIASLKQILTYKSNMDFSVFSVACEKYNYNQGLEKYVSKVPIEMVIIARYIDADIVDIARELGITLFKISVKYNNTIDLCLVGENIEAPLNNHITSKKIKEMYSWLGRAEKQDV